MKGSVPASSSALVPIRHPADYYWMKTVMASDRPTPMNSKRDLQRLEDAARAAIAVQLGRAVSNEEWARTRGRLVEFARILRLWQNSQPRDAADGAAKTDDSLQESATGACMLDEAA